MAEIAPIEDAQRPPKSDTRRSQVYAWGQSSEGQLGLGEGAMEEGKVTSPTVIEELSSVYVAHLANGLEHTMVVASSEEI